MLKSQRPALKQREFQPHQRAAHDAEEYVPTAEAKKAYHNLARAIHPDLALDANEKERRHGLMAELNQAYSSGDQAKLDRMIEDLKSSPDSVKGDSIGDDWVRAVRQIYQIRKRFAELDVERTNAEASELHELRMKVKAEMAEGRDLLKQMAERTKTHIIKAKRRLENLKNVNAAQEEYVREEFGMDISDFRQ